MKLKHIDAIGVRIQLHTSWLVYAKGGYDTEDIYYGLYLGFISFFFTICLKQEETYCGSDY